MQDTGEFMTPERRAVWNKLHDLSGDLQVLDEGLGEEMFALGAEHTETWQRMPDSLWDLANDLRKLALRAYRIAVECDDATQDIQPGLCTYQEHKEHVQMIGDIVRRLDGIPLSRQEEEHK